MIGWKQKWINWFTSLFHAKNCVYAELRLYILAVNFYAISLSLITTYKLHGIMYFAHELIPLHFVPLHHFHIVVYTIEFCYDGRVEHVFLFTNFSLFEFQFNIVVGVVVVVKACSTLKLYMRKTNITFQFPNFLISLLNSGNIKSAKIEWCAGARALKSKHDLPSLWILVRWLKMKM